MADLLDSFLFSAKPGGPAPTYEQLQTRRKIAAAMMSRQQKGFPKTLGEGLTYLGDAIGDVGYQNKLDQMERANALRTDEVLRGTGIGGAPATPPVATSLAAPEEPVATPPRAVPVAATPDVRNQGDYNEIDAQAGLPQSRTTPGYMQDAIARATDNPDMRAYLGTLTAAEAKGPNDVSRTGASGPFQFTRGTGQQYGLVGPGGDQRADLDASAQAALKLTQDNAAIFQRINGRPPTMAELAVMHQQGGTTGAKMVAGTGNAPAQNLAVNNISPQASPAQAVGAMNNYYQMPDRTIDPRARVAAAMTPQSALAFSGQPTNANAPVPPPPAPPAQVIPATPAPPPTAQVQAAPVAPKPPTPTPQMLQIDRALSVIGDPIQRDALTRKYQELKAEQEATYKAAQEEYQYRRGQFETAPERATKLATEKEQLTAAQQKNRLIAQFGNMPPDEVFKNLTASQALARSAAQSLTASQQAMEAFNRGAITGTGANMRLDAAKFFNALGLVDKGNVIQNTEVFRQAMQPVIANILHQTSGTSQLSEGELRFAQRAAAGDITLEPNSIRQLMAIIDKSSRGVINDHQKKLDALFGDSNPQAAATFGVEMPKPIAAPGSIVDVGSEAEAAKLPKGTKVRINGRTGTVQ